ncbi:MAG: type II/IV secretion system ATPase subunit [Acidimicrobiia bacterium]|nr:type II/IV secretion system ATPase subunit [Acidimicrobiia bacterium]
MTRSGAVYDTLLGRVHDEIERRDDVSVSQNPHAVAGMIAEVVHAYQAECTEGGQRPLRNPEIYIDRLRRFVLEQGPLTPYLADSTVSEIRIEDDYIEVQREDGVEICDEPTTSGELFRLMDRLVQESTGQTDLSPESPMIRCSHPGWGGLRLSVTGPPISTSGVIGVIRKRRLKRFTLLELVERGSLTRPAAAFLWALMQERPRILITGQPYSGKTSLLAALHDAVPRRRKIRSIEAPQELPRVNKNVSYLEAQEGVPGQELIDVLVDVLTKSPWIVSVGEIKGEEAFYVRRAATSGAGFLATLHAPSAVEAIGTLVTAALPHSGARNIGARDLAYMFATNLHLVVHLDWLDAGGRDPRELHQVTAISAVVAEDGAGANWRLDPIFERAVIGKPMEVNLANPDLGSLTELVERQLPDGVSLSRIIEGAWDPWA